MSSVNLTILYIKSVGRQSQCGATVFTLEAAAVEELALCAQPLHHIHTFSTEEANVTATDVDRELFPEGALEGTETLIGF